MLALQNSLLMRGKWELGCTDQVDLDLRKTEGKCMHAHGSFPKPSPSAHGECGLKSCPALSLQGFLHWRPGLCSSCQGERKIMRKHTKMLLSSHCLPVSEMQSICIFYLNCAASPSLPPSLSSFLYVFHLPLKMGWKWFKFYSKIDWILMKTSIVWLRVIQSPYLEGKANVMKPGQYSDPWRCGRHGHPVTSCSWQTFEEELLLFRK